jgi:G:T-mismatch repair DNA endonuclease (very short patch repair protein)
LFEGNAERDKRHLQELRALGWTVVLWECETRDAEALEAKLWAFLRGKG